MKAKLLAQIDGSIRILYLTKLISYGELEKIKVRLAKKIAEQEIEA